jgi:hypothetical protein
VDHPYSISDFAFSFRRREGTTRDLIERSGDSPDRGSSHGKGSQYGLTWDMVD